MARKKILWLCSWYPGKTAPFNGDFIQRHARAAALYNDIHTIHVIGDSSGLILKHEESFNYSPGLTEQIIYFRRTDSPIGKLKAHTRWVNYFRHAINLYIKKFGKPDLVHVQVPMKAGLLALWVKRKYKIPYVITEHWGIYNDVEVENYQKKTSVFKYFTKRIFRQAKIGVTVSNYLAKGINKLVTKKEFVIVPNVVDTTSFYFMKPPQTVFRFIHVSNMVPLKNAEGILKAFKIVTASENNVELVMVGDTNQAIRDFASAIKIKPDTILFRGEIAYEQVARELQASDCFILFSNIENSPCVIGEALCCGLPVIATNVGGIPELVNNSNSILICPGDEAALTEAMRTMIMKAAIYNRKLIADEAKNKFSYTVVGKELDRIYSLAGAGNSSTGS